MSNKETGLKINYEEGTMSVTLQASVASKIETTSNDPHIIALQQRVMVLEKQLNDMQAAMSCFLGSLNFHCFELQNKMITKNT